MLKTSLLTKTKALQKTIDEVRRLQAAGFADAVQGLSVTIGHEPSQVMEAHIAQLIDFL